MTVPDLGPIVPGDKSILEYSCTHVTSGLGWPAFDAGWIAGRAVLAPEQVKVYDNTSSAQGGEAFYVRGTSGIQYWVAHITTVPSLNANYSKGATITKISPDHPRPHVHLAVDARKLLGGEHLKTGEGYSLGAPTIGEQLGAADKPPPPPPGKEPAVEDWVAPWLEWYIHGQHHEPPDERPDAPKTIPPEAWELQKTVVEIMKTQGADACYQEWLDWYQTGRQGELRPACAPSSIPPEWWAARNRALKLT